MSIVGSEDADERLAGRTFINSKRVMGTKVLKMGNTLDKRTDETDSRESLMLHIDDRGRVTIPKAVRERLGIEPNSDVPASVLGSVLTIDPTPSEKLQPATADRTDWAQSTPTDAGESLFGSMDTE
jgi:AbrB family looped-hinge helix DNA binding protein